MTGGWRTGADTPSAFSHLFLLEIISFFFCLAPARAGSCPPAYMAIPAAIG
jgi:hypothetical protein